MPLRGGPLVSVRAARYGFGMSASPPPVAILLATRQGAEFLDAQLQSLATQSYGNWRLVLSDDGSTDGTLQIARRFAADHPDREVTILSGPRRGATQNFLHLVDSVRPGEALAYCDQDDVWLPERLAIGIAAIGEAERLPDGANAGEQTSRAPHPAGMDGTSGPDDGGISHSMGGLQSTEGDRGGVAGQSPRADTLGKSHLPGVVVGTRDTIPATPAEGVGDWPRAMSPADPVRALHAASSQAILHVTRTTICDAALRPLRPAPLYTRPAGFLNALVQACTPGNTMLVDPAGAAILKAAAPAAARERVVAHDWWSYLAIAGAGGRIIRDPRQTVLYRQHGDNVMGRNDTPRARLARLSRLGAGEYGDWLRANIAALQAVEPLLTPENRRRLADFATALDETGPVAAWALARLGVYRQTRSGTAALLAAAAAGRLRPRAGAAARR